MILLGNISDRKLLLFKVLSLVTVLHGNISDVKILCVEVLSLLTWVRVLLEPFPIRKYLVLGFVSDKHFVSAFSASGFNLELFVKGKHKFALGILASLKSQSSSWKNF